MHRGYSADKAEAISNFTGTQQEIIALAAGATIYSGYSYTSGSGTDWYISFSWGWSSEPFFKGTDLIGIRILGSVNGTTAACTVSSSGSYAIANYYVQNDSTVSGGPNYLTFFKPDVSTGQFIYLCKHGLKHILIILT
ncbi:hypothetical protein CLLI_24440 [Clostridium liquoris]|uniref:Uncharacterized protein n=1 Tax=Clostridium liquoris TaxID=1289519 RepID=A0A2T0B0Y9_9CLOT|nr:hypothetical protein [Clostridium liquoris]PRR77274.1 hypothetical protein CLLI_24440 [Clostridium liquoris]